MKKDDLDSSSLSVVEPEVLTPGCGWKVFPSSDIPAMFNFGHIYFYLVESVDETSQKQSEERDDEVDTSAVGN